LAFGHDDFVMLDISKENSGFSILTTYVESNTCVENKITLINAHGIVYAAPMHENFRVFRVFRGLKVFLR
jgi:hypothetical protein